MIKNILFPDKIGSYYIFKKRIIGFDINKTHVIATQTCLYGNTVTLEKIFVEAIGPTLTSNINKKISANIKVILNKCAPYDEIRTQIQSSSAIFKKLNFPFLNEEKIKQVINYEIESYIPFPIEDALVDFVCTSKNEKEKTTDIITVIVQKQLIDQHINLFKEAGANPNVISVNAIDLFSLYTLIPKNEKSALLIDINLAETTIFLTQDNELTHIRTIPKGLEFLTKQIIKSNSVDTNNSIEKILRFGLENQKDKTTTKKILDEFLKIWQSITLTVESVKSTSNFSIEKIYLSSCAAEINGIGTLIESLSKIKTENLPLNKIWKKRPYRKKTLQHITPIETQSISSSITTKFNADFNLIKTQQEKLQASIIIKQLWIAFLLCGSIFALFFSHIHFQIKKLNNNLDASKKELLSELRKELKIPQNRKNKNEVIGYARSEVLKEKEIWFAFSATRSSQFLKYLQELSSAIDRESLGLELKHLFMSPDEIIMEGSVKDFDALAILEDELEKSKLFSKISTSQSTQFTIHLTVMKEEEAL